MQKKTIWDMARPTVDQYRRATKMPVVVVLDNVRSLNNIGSLFRTADCFAASGIALCGISATPPSPEIHKTALGAEDTVRWEYYADTLDAVGALRGEGYTICSLELAHDSVPLDKFRPEAGKRYAVIAGHEVNGVRQDVVDASDLCLEIPQEGTKHSLNVAVSTALAIWHFYLYLRDR